MNSNHYSWSNNPKNSDYSREATKKWASGITEDMIIDDYDAVKSDLNSKVWISNFDEYLVQLSNSTSMLTAPQEKDPVAEIGKYCDWAKEENWSDRLRLFMRLKDK